MHDLTQHLTQFQLQQLLQWLWLHDMKATRANVKKWIKLNAI